VQNQVSHEGCRSFPAGVVELGRVKTVEPDRHVADLDGVTVANVRHRALQIFGLRLAEWPGGRDHQGAGE
jgi:hypothetical protein